MPRRAAFLPLFLCLSSPPLLPKTMLARERLPALARHLPSNKTPRALIFFHMAKTGGTSVIVEL